MDMIVYTGEKTILDTINGTNINGWCIEIINDGAGVPFINEETLNNPIFENYKYLFNQLQPITYTPSGEQ